MLSSETQSSFTHIGRRARIQMQAHTVCCIQTMEWDGHGEPTAVGSIADCISIPHLATMRPFLWQPAAEW